MVLSPSTFHNNTQKHKLGSLFLILTPKFLYFRYLEYIQKSKSALIVTNSEISVYQDGQSHERWGVNFDDILLCDLSLNEDYLLVIDKNFDVSLLLVSDFKTKYQTNLLDDSDVKQPLNEDGRSGEPQSPSKFEFSVFFLYTQIGMHKKRFLDFWLWSWA